MSDRRKYLTRSFVVLLALFWGAVHQQQARAGTFTFSDTTSGGPTIPILQIDEEGTVLNRIDIHFSLLQFTVSEGGAYTIISESMTPGRVPFPAVFQNEFDPANQDILFANIVAADFTGTPVVSLGISDPLILTAGTNYFYITTLVTPDLGSEAFYASDPATQVGNFTTTISGPGDIRPVPEPATLLLLVTGLAGLGGVIRRGRQVKEE